MCTEMWNGCACLESNIGVLVHSKYLGLVAEGQLLNVVPVGLDGVDSRCVVDAGGRVLVALLECLGREEALQNSSETPLVPGISDSASICDLVVYESMRRTITLL